MKKLLLLTAMLCFMVLHVYEAKAQFSVDAAFGMYKSFAKDSDGVFGVNLAAKYQLSDNLRAGIGFGYYSKSTTVFNIKVRSFVMPIVANIEYILFDDGFAPYVGIDAGVYSFGATSSGSTNSNAYLGVAPIVGVDFPLNDMLFVTGNLKYNFLPKENLKDGFGFNIGLSIRP